jgi:multidrug efflux system membrane fusion protein
MDTRTPPSYRTFSDAVGRVTSRFDSRLWSVAIGVAALALVLYVWHLIAGGGAPKEPPPAPIHVGVATTGDFDVVDHTLGTVLAQSTVNVTPQVTGQIIAANFKEGQIVKRGDLLFQIDPRPFQAALAQAEAALARDQANLVSAANDQIRFTALFKQNAVSQQQRDQAVATANADRALVKSDEAAIAIAKLNLGYTEIRSPVDGKTGPIQIYPGNVVTIASATQIATPLVTIMQIQPVKVSFALPQSDVPQIQNQIRAGKLIAIIPMEGAEGGRETAPVDFMSNAVSAQAGTIELRATFPNTDLRLVPGQMVNVGVTIRNLRKVVIVPRDAVNVGPDNNYVYVVDAQSRAVQVPVEVLHDDGKNDAISGNVKAGDQVITEGQLRVVPGAAVAISSQPSSAFVAPTEPGAQ